MNQRILDLAFKLFNEDDQSGPGTYIQLNVEKFAESIVHQMLDITDAHTEVFQTDRDLALIEHIKQSVKQHFGVEA